METNTKNREEQIVSVSVLAPDDNGSGLTASMDSDVSMYAEKTGVSTVPRGISVKRRPYPDTRVIGGLSYPRYGKREEDASEILEDDVEIPIEVVEKTDEDNNFRQVVCPSCLIRDLVGCDHCALYLYGFKHKQYKFNVTKIE